MTRLSLAELPLVLRALVLGVGLEPCFRNGLVPQPSRLDRHPLQVLWRGDLLLAEFARNGLLERVHRRRLSVNEIELLRWSRERPQPAEGLRVVMAVGLPGILFLNPTRIRQHYGAEVGCADVQNARPLNPCATSSGR
jgi:hypothetical protein